VNKIKEYLHTEGVRQAQHILITKVQLKSKGVTASMCAKDHLISLRLYILRQEKEPTGAK